MFSYTTILIFSRLYTKTAEWGKKMHFNAPKKGWPRTLCHTSSRPPELIHLTDQLRIGGKAHTSVTPNVKDGTQRNTKNLVPDRCTLQVLGVSHYRAHTRSLRSRRLLFLIAAHRGEFERCWPQGTRVHNTSSSHV